MDNVPWQPTNEPGRYDAARVATLEPIHQAIEHLQLPPIRLRKLNAIRNALEMQIEDGGDSPKVNNHLLEALQIAVIHQVGQKRAMAVLQAIGDFARLEEIRWKQVQDGMLPLNQNTTTFAPEQKPGKPKRKFRSRRRKGKKK